MTLEMKFQEKFEEGKHQGLELGKQQGLELGKQQGLELGKHQGLELGKIDILIHLVHDGILTEEDAARRAEMTVKKFSEFI